MSEQHSVTPLTPNEAGQRFTLMALEVHDYAIFQMDINGTILTWNKAAETMKGYSADEAIGNFFGMLYTEEDRERGHPEHNLRKAAEEGAYQEETWRQKKDGSLFWAMVEIIALKPSGSELIGFGKITRDMTAQKRLQDQIAADKQRAQVTLGAIGDAVISMDADGHIEYLNPKAEQLTGWCNRDAQSRSFDEVFHLADEFTLHPQEHQLVSWLKQGRVIPANAPAVLVSKDGTRYAIEDTAAPIRLPDGQVIGGVVVFRDVTQARHELNTVTHQATHDALTGLVNRIEFEKRLQRSLARTQQSHAAGAVLYMDLDQFKVVNDTCGHDAGDKLLTQLANLYRNEIRERDTLARLGGDEFALIADHCSVGEAYLIADKILQSTRDFQFICNERVFKVGVSIGLVMFDETSHGTQEILQLADQACYVAKDNGRNQIYAEPPGKPVPMHRKGDIDWVFRLSEAMRLNQLKLHYQPIATANGDDGGLHYEVLLRLADPEHGVILPDRFLAVAERYDLMPTIDRWVVQHVFQWLQENRKHAEQLKLCAINLSARTLADDSFLGYVSDLIKQHNASPEKLCFEIAETAAIIDMQKSVNLINGLRAMGCKVSLGGFGTGMASFVYLKRLPADFVKIAGSFVSTITQSIVDEQMVKSVNDIAHLMGIRTIAECVENQATVEALSRIGIDYLQGHWIAYPTALECEL